MFDKIIISKRVNKKVDTYHQILQHLSNGLISKQIGPILGYSPRTIEAFIDDMKFITDSQTIAQLVAKAIRNKTID